MPNNNYQKGYNFEKRVRVFFEKDGFDVTESRGSHSIKDLVACKGFPQYTLVFYIQCKTDKGLLTREDWNKLIETSDKAGAHPLFAWREDGGAHRLHIWELLVTRAPHVRVKNGIQYKELL